MNVNHNSHLVLGAFVVVMIAGLVRESGAQDAQLKEAGYTRGDARAPIVVIEFGDFACSACATFAHASFAAINQEYVATGKVFWRYVPFDAGFRNGADAARASECAAEQDAFWPMHDLLFKNQSEWIKMRKPQEVFASYARTIQLDSARYQSCYRENRGKQRTRTNNQLARKLGVRATPTFFVNGRMVKGSLPLESFRLLLQSEE